MCEQARQQAYEEMVDHARPEALRRSGCLVIHAGSREIHRSLR